MASIASSAFLWYADARLSFGSMSMMPFLIPAHQASLSFMVIPDLSFQHIPDKRFGVFPDDMVFFHFGYEWIEFFL